MTLHVHRAQRTSELAGRLAELLRTVPSDPFAPDVVAVPTRGVERWLAQRLSHALGASDGDGVCANVSFPSPGALLADVLTTHSFLDPADDPWEPGRLTWTLLEVVDGSLDESWCEALASHLDATGTNPPGRRLMTAQRLARLFTSYAESRPEMIRAWAAGDDNDGAGAGVPGDLAWQPELWRRLRATVAEPSPAERLPDVCRLIREDSQHTDLPDRVSLFGPTRLTTAQLEVLDALAAHRDVHLWLPHPSPRLWDRLASYDGARRRREDTSAALTNNPLLASLGRDVRELQVRLARHASVHDDELITPEETDEPATLLRLLQDSIRDDLEPTRPIDATRGDSLQVHACHGPARQVEVLREVLVGLLADDPTLEPRDVLVMCPNVEDYAPLISATFGLAEDGDDTTHPGHRLRVRLADRSLRQTNPMLDLIATLLDLAGGRVTATELLDLTALPPVRRRFHFADDDLEQLQAWAGATNVRWGLDAVHRQPYGLGQVPNNTWRRGLDRILLGASMTEDELRWVGSALPLDDVDSNDIDLAGRFAELVDRLTTVLDRLTGERALADWLAALTDAADLLGATSDADAWQRSQALRELAELSQQTTSTPQLGLGDVHALLADRLAGRPTRANFRTGNLTMCSMVPMRSVPHRVVVLLGLDDGAFPRTGAADGDDLLARDPQVGERDPRSEDRQLMLDAIMAAREHLVILYTGNDPRTNAARPPAVPVGELLDTVDALARYDGKPAREHVVTRHPLQPFDPRNFTPGVLGTTARAFSFDQLSLAGARRAALPRKDDNPFLDDLLPKHAGHDEVTLDDLIAFVEQPVKAFLRQRLAMTVRGDEGNHDLPDELSIELDGLQRWAIGERLLQEVIRGTNINDCTQAEARRGTLPPGEFGKRMIERIKAEVEPLYSACRPYLAQPSESIDVTVDVDDRRRLVGTVGGVRGEVILRATYSTLAAKHRARAWVQLLALSAAHPETAWTATTIGKGRGGGSISTLTPVSAELARATLAELITLRDAGMREPLPMSAKTSAAYAELRQRADVGAALSKACREWEGTNSYEGERGDPAHVRVFGAASAFDVLTAEVHDGPEGTRFGQLARLVWDPILAHERVSAA